MRKKPTDAYPEIFYVLMNLDLADKEKRQLLEAIPESIFHGAPIVLKVLDPTPIEQVAAFIAGFREKKSIFPYGL